MAQIVERQTKTSGTSYQVKWRAGGGRTAPWQSESFSARGRAEVFRREVEAAGHNWPPGWVKGQGYATPTPAERTSPRVTVGEVAESYFARQERRVTNGRIDLYTVHRYRRSWALHLAETFEHMDATEVTIEDVEAWIELMQEEKHSAKSIRNWHGIFYSIMGEAQVRMKLRSDHPSTGIELPATTYREDRQVRFLQHGEWRLFRSCLNSDVHLLVDVMLASGMRWGEASALRRGDVTRDDDGVVSLHVVRAWQKRAPGDDADIQEQFGENKSWRVGPPKGHKSRFITLHGKTADELWDDIRDLPDRAYVFRTRDGNPWRYPDFHSDRWAPARATALRLGLEKKVTPHMLRHTTCVWSLAEGVRIEEISEMLGHASISITYDIYGGTLNIKNPEAARRMAKAMLMAETALTPVAPDEVVAARKIRPGRRGERRSRVA